MKDNILRLWLRIHHLRWYEKRNEFIQCVRYHDPACRYDGEVIPDYVVMTWLLMDGLLVLSVAIGSVWFLVAHL